MSFDKNRVTVLYKIETIFRTTYSTAKYYINIYQDSRGYYLTQCDLSHFLKKRPHSSLRG